MKLGTEIFRDGDHRWVAIARDPGRPGYLIDTIEYVVLKNGKAAVLDPGGQEVFPAVFSAVAQLVLSRDIEFLFASHQDPDICSSFPLWLAANPELKAYISWLWASFVPHFGGDDRTWISIPDEGMEVRLGGELALQFLPAHYLHSAGNFHVYDARARILWSGDVGSALLPDTGGAPLFVEDFDRHIPYMRGFHQRWMPSNESKNAWIDRVASMRIDLLCPQHGAIFKGENVARFLQWFRDLDVGIAAQVNRGSRVTRPRPNA